MQKHAFLALGFALAQAPLAYAQLTTLPPPSLDEGIFVQPIGINQGTGHWENPLNLGAYLSATGNPLGLTWQTGMHGDFALGLNQIEHNGGTLRAIFLGAPNSHGEDFGYSRSGSPTAGNSFTLIENLPSPSPAYLADFGNFTDFNFSIPDYVGTFDFWLNCDDGAYTFFQPSLGSPLPTGNLRWSATPLYTSTWVQSLNGGLGGYTDIATFLLRLDEPVSSQALGNPGEAFIMALQIFPADGGPLTPVPEPATYSLIGAVTLVGLALRRRFHASK